jgi:hypothetical protein
VSITDPTQPLPQEGPDDDHDDAAAPPALRAHPRRAEGLTDVAAVELFDFRDASELSTDAELRASEVLHTAIPRCALVLSTLTRRNVTAALTRFELIDHRDLGTDGCDLYDITIAVRGNGQRAGTRHPLGVAVLPRVSVTGLAEVLMGGPGDGEGRVPNRFERSLLCRRLAEALVPLWDGLGVHGTETPGLTYVEPSMAQLPLSTVAVGMSFAIGERSWELTLAVSSSVIDASLDPRPAGGTVTMAGAVKDVPVDLAVGFAPIRITAADVERIAVGDVIRLDHTVGVPLVAEVQGRPLLLVQHGTTGRRLAAEVIQVLDMSHLVAVPAIPDPDPAYPRPDADASGLS